MTLLQSGKRLALIGIPLTMLVAGVVDQGDVMDPPIPKTAAASVLSAVLNILGCILTFLWYRQDAAEIGFKRTVYWDASIILFTVIIALPAYLFKSRGAGAGFVSFAKLLAFVVFGMLLPYAITLSLPDLY